MGSDHRYRTDVLYRSLPCIVISNQSGINLGRISPSEATSLTKPTKRIARASCCKIPDRTHHTSPDTFASGNHSPDCAQFSTACGRSDWDPNHCCVWIPRECSSTSSSFQLQSWAGICSTRHDYYRFSHTGHTPCKNRWSFHQDNYADVSPSFSFETFDSQMLLSSQDRLKREQVW